MNNRKDENQRSKQQLSSLLGAGMVFPVSLAIGYAIGYYLDRWLGALPNVWRVKRLPEAGHFVQEHGEAIAQWALRNWT